MKIPNGWVVKVKPYRHGIGPTLWCFRVNREGADTPCWFGSHYPTRQRAIGGAISAIPKIEAEEPEAEWETING